jgi:hypothetical protein
LKAKRPFISCEATIKALAGSNIVCPAIDSNLFMTYSAFLIESGFIQMG